MDKKYGWIQKIEELNSNFLFDLFDSTQIRTPNQLEFAGSSKQKFLIILYNFIWSEICFSSSSFPLCIDFINFFGFGFRAVQKHEKVGQTKFTSRSEKKQLFSLPDLKTVFRVKKFGTASPIVVLAVDSQPASNFRLKTPKIKIY